MNKRRSPDSLLTKLENLEVGGFIWAKKSSGYVADTIATVKKRYPGRKYKQVLMPVHTKPFDDTLTLADFEKIIFITRLF